MKHGNLSYHNKTDLVVWQINDFSRIVKSKIVSVRSPSFKLFNLENEWFLEFYPVGFLKPNYASLVLCFEPKRDEKVRIYFKVSLGSMYGRKFGVWESGSEGAEFHKNNNKEYSFKYVKLEDVTIPANGLLFGDTLKLVCEIKNNSAFICDGKPEEKEVDTIFTDIKELYEKKEMCDVMIRVGEKEMMAHKVILGAASPVFKAMFTGNTKENLENLVNITDFDFETVNQMVNFIYTNEGPDFHSCGPQILAISDKYDIKRLKEATEYQLSKKLSVENAVVTLIIADSTNSPDLKKNASDFITCYSKSIVDTEEWKNLLCHQHSSLAFELLEIMAKKYGKMYEHE